MRTSLPDARPVAETEPLAATLRARIFEELRDLLPRRSRVALVNYPNIGNVGDVAIWLGTRAMLARLGVSVVHECEWRTYRRRLVAGAVSDTGMILLQGGGNLGDVYMNQQGVRRRILRDFPRARVLQLPQTIWFRRPAAARRFGEACQRHSGFELFVRDLESLELARTDLGLDATLCPDMAFGLELVAPGDTPTEELLVLARRDRRERSDLGTRAARRGLATVDWRQSSATDGSTRRQGSPWLALNRRLTARARRSGHLARFLASPIRLTHMPIARRRLAAGLRLLARGRVVVTDRLHGHVLCLLIGKPHVWIDNAYGKNRRFRETWTSESPLARWADDPDEALDLAAEWAAALRAGETLP